MKRPLAVLACFTLATVSTAGILGWITSQTRSWSFVQQTGGIRIAAPVKVEGKVFLPVEFCVQGTVAVTCKPKVANSGLSVRRVEASYEEPNVIIRVVTQLAEKGSDNGRIHYVDLSGIPPGAHKVYYENAGDTEKLLGQIEFN